jgi:lysophospholipase L1-like esterase
MKSLFYSLLFILIVTACSNSDGGGGAAGPKITNSKPGAGSIYVMGDSLAYGSGSTVEKDTPQGCFANAFVGEKVYNVAIPGLTTDGLVDNVPYYLSQPLKLAFISTGGNDALSEYYQPGSYPADKSVRELKRIILQFQTAGAVVVYLAINPPFDPAASKRLQEMAKVARENGAIVVDGMAGLWNTAKMSDDFHPNDEGYKVMCDRILSAVSAHYP